MPARLQSGQAAPRAGRRGRRDRRQYRRAAPVRRQRQQSFQRYYRKRVGTTRGVGRAVGRGRDVRHRQRVAAHRRRVSAKKAREQKRQGYTDAAQQTPGESERIERFKRTPLYRSAIRAAHRGATPAWRARTLRAARAAPESVESRVALGDLSARRKRREIRSAFDAAQPRRGGGTGRAAASERLLSLMGDPSNRRLARRMDAQGARAARRYERRQGLGEVSGIAKAGTEHSGVGGKLYDAVRGAASYLGDAGNRKFEGSIADSLEVKTAGALLKIHQDHQRRTMAGPGTETERAIGDVIAHPRKHLKRWVRASQERQVRTAGVDPSLVAVGEVASETISHPGKVGMATLKSVPKIAAGLGPATVKAGVQLATDPIVLARAVEADLGRRYGKDARKAVREEGLLPYLLDVGAAGSVAGRAVGTAARGTRLMKEPRPRMRTGGRTRRQRLSPNIILAAAQRRHDRARLQAQKNRARKGRPRPIDAALASDEVTPVLRRRERSRTRSRFAQERGIGTLGMQDEIARDVAKPQRALRIHTRPKTRARKEAAVRYFLELGLTPETWQRELRGRRTQVLGERARREGDDRPVDTSLSDEVAVIDDLLEHPKLVTPQIRELADQYRETGARVGAGDPAFHEITGRIRAAGPQALHTGAARLDREERLTTKGEQLEAAQSAERVAGKEVKLAKTALEAARREQQLFRGKNAPAGRTRAPTVAALERRDVGVVEARQRVASAKVALEQAEKIRQETQQLPGERHFIPGLVDREGRPLTVRTEDGRQMPTEHAEPWLLEAEQAAKARGLEPGGYFPHQEFARPKLSDFTHGAAARGAVAGEKKTDYERFTTGTAQSGTDPLFQQYARNIKRRYNWNFVADTVEDFAYRSFRDRENQEKIDVAGVTVPELERALQRAGIAASEVAFYNPRILRRSAKGKPGTEIDGDALASMHDAWQQATNPSAFRNEPGWYVLPREVYDEMNASMASQSLAGRIVRKYVKGIPSKLILGTNPSWAIIQVANNAALAALARVGPHEWAAAQKFFNDNPDVRAALRPQIGATPFRTEQRGAKLAGAVRSPHARYYQAWKEHSRFAQAAGRANPLDWLFRFDHAQNIFFREAIAFNRAKKLAYERMGNGTSAIGRGMQRVEGPLDGLAEAVGKQDTNGVLREVRALTKERQALEEIGAGVDEVLGNYSRYTANERRFLEQNLMFYGFLRFSLRFTFWTLPTKHPIVANVLTTLSRLHEDEVRRLLGVDADDPLPFGALATFYSGEGKNLKAVELARLNPAMNVLTQAQGPSALMGAAPPLVQALGNMVAGKNIYFNQPWRVRGESTERDRLLGYGEEQYGRIFMRDAFLNTLAPYRLWEQTQVKGRSVGADVLAWDVRPTKYAEPTSDEQKLAAAGRASRKKRAEGKSLWDFVKGSQLAWAQALPSEDREIAQSLKTRRDRELEALKGKKKKRRKSIREEYRSGAGSRQKTVREEYRDFSAGPSKSVRDDYREFVR